MKISRIDLVGLNGGDGEHYKKGDNIMQIDLDLLSKQQKRKLQYIIKDIKMPKIKVKLLNEDCMPERTHRWDAGWDLKAANAVLIPAGQTAAVATGVIFEVPNRHFGMVVPRSSLGTKYRVTLANDVGIIDSEYRGEILVFLTNDSDEDYLLNKGERFAQILILPVNTSELWAVDNVSVTERGTGGFGSTNEDIPPKVDHVEDAAYLATQIEEVNEKPTPVFKEPREPVRIVLDQVVEYDGDYETENVSVDVNAGNLKDVWGEDEVPMDEVKFPESSKLLSNLTPVEYIKLRKKGKLKDEYPQATGDMKVDLCL